MITLVCLVSLVQVSLTLETQPGENSCGLSSCFLFLRQMGVPVDWDSLAADESFDKSETSFLDLRQTLQRHGINTLPVQLSLPLLKRLRCHAIIQTEDPSLKRRHFQVISPYRDTLVLLDPLLSRPVILGAEGESLLEQQFTGAALIDVHAMPRWNYQALPQIVSVIACLAVIVIVLILRFCRSTAPSQSERLPMS